MTNQAPIKDSYDVLVVGGGPGGTTVGHLLAKKGWDVLIVEKEQHPRWQIGESLLPYSTRVWDELGVWDTLEASAYERKYGAWFDFHEGHDPEAFWFGGDNPGRGDWAWNVERSWLDEMLWKAALAAGAQGAENTEAAFLIEGSGVSAKVTGADLTLADGSTKRVTARLTVDAAGRTSVLGSALGIRRPDPKLNMMAMYGHYRGAQTFPGNLGGFISIIGIADGWGWAIPFHDGRISVGMVVRNTAFSERIKGRTPADVFAEYVAATPAITDRLGPDAVLDSEVRTTGNYSFRCDTSVGDGWAMVGDAGAFIDPVFSSGVHLAMEGGRRLVRDVDAALRKASSGLIPASRLARYAGDNKRALKVFSRFIYDWYDDEFRLAFMRPPPKSRAVQLVKTNMLRILAGDVYTPWKVLPWMYTLEFMAKLNAAGVKRMNGGALPPPGCVPAVVPGRDAPKQIDAPTP